MDNAGVDNDRGKAQEVNNDGVDFTELSSAAALRPHGSVAASHRQRQRQQRRRRRGRAVDGVYCDDFAAVPDPAAAAADEPADCCEVRLVAPREGSR